MPPMRTVRAAGLSLVTLLLGLAGCGSIVGHFTKPLMHDLTTSFMKQRDLALAETGAPAFLLIIDGLIDHSPKNKALLLAGAQAYSAYGSAFVGEKDPERNKMLTDKAKEYALRAMSLHSKKFAEVKDKPYETFVTCLEDLGAKDVPYLFYTATCWAGWIQAHSSDYDALSDLPKVQRLVERVLELDERFYYGGPHLFMGVLLTIRPPAYGGKPEEAREHFEKAIRISGGKFLMDYVMYAKQYARLTYDRELHDTLLKKVLETPADIEPELTLINTVAKKKALELLNSADEYF
jgi:tetratricopeptide (TPR) repeat protein